MSPSDSWGDLLVSGARVRRMRPSVELYLMFCLKSTGGITENDQTHTAVLSLEKKSLCDTLYLDSRAAGDLSLYSPENFEKYRNGNSYGNMEVSICDISWNQKAIIHTYSNDVMLEISVHDRYDPSARYGILKLRLNLSNDGAGLGRWFSLLRTRNCVTVASGEIYLSLQFRKTAMHDVGRNDFETLRMIGSGAYGRVYQVRGKTNRQIYAMKVLKKKDMIRKKATTHVISERNVLVQAAMECPPFIIPLRYCFQTRRSLYIVTDYMPGGDLFWHMLNEGQFQEERVKFYVSEIVLALEYLHGQDIVYRDLKPENILLDIEGHLALCDFGFAKSGIRKNELTSTICGTNEYLAPEVLVDENGYTRMVDFWSLGVLTFEMCYGWSPFQAKNAQDIYNKIVFGTIYYPKGVCTDEARDFIRRLLDRDPRRRLGAREGVRDLKRHSFLRNINWEELSDKEVIPPFKPNITSDTDTSYFDSPIPSIGGALSNGERSQSTAVSPGSQEYFRGFAFNHENLDGRCC